MPTRCCCALDTTRLDTGERDGRHVAAAGVVAPAAPMCTRPRHAGPAPGHAGSALSPLGGLRGLDTAERAEAASTEAGAQPPASPPPVTSVARIEAGGAP